MALRFYNTLTQRIEEFTPAEDNVVRMYTCGPTVWNFAHIGNLRTFTFVDILRRWLRSRGYKLDHVMNITDVDDRIIQQAMAAGKSLDEYTAVYTEAFLEDSATLRLERPERLVRATHHIDDMAAAIRKLSERSYTYESEGSIYFRIAKFPEYGKLSHTDFSGIRAGARVDTDRYEKDDARDFALWKAPKEGEPCWDTVIGRGRPGWHIECSVMAMKYLGETLDIHAGGVDLTFPHHENEIAQSEALTGKPFSRFWLHSEHLILAGEIMSKSLGNFLTLRDLLDQGFQPEAVRYLLASVPYRKKLNFTMDSLRSAEHGDRTAAQLQAAAGDGEVPRGRERGPARADRARPPRQFDESPRRRPQHRRGAGGGLRIRAGGQHGHGRGRIPRRRTLRRRSISWRASTRSSTCCGPAAEGDRPSAMRRSRRSSPSATRPARRKNFARAGRDPQAAAGARHHPGGHQRGRPLEEEIT